MITKGLFTSNHDNWSTPQKLFDSLNDEFHFTLDVCATPENAKCNKYFTKEDDGLKQSWNDDVVFCNPPYGRDVDKWIKKASESKGTVVMLIPARTDTKWFHKYIWVRKFENRPYIRFLKGRLKFNDGKKPAPFPSMIVIWKHKDRRKDSLCQK